MRVCWESIVGVPARRPAMIHSATLVGLSGMCPIGGAWFSRDHRFPKWRSRLHRRNGFELKCRSTSSTWNRKPKCARFPYVNHSKHASFNPANHRKLAVRPLPHPASFRHQVSPSPMLSGRLWASVNNGASNMSEYCEEGANDMFDMARTTENLGEDESTKGMEWTQIFLLHGFALLYGANAVAVKALDQSPSVPVSLSCAVKFGFGAIAFSPVLLCLLPRPFFPQILPNDAPLPNGTSDTDLFMKSRESDEMIPLLYAGFELSSLLLAAIFTQSTGLGGASASGNASLLFFYTILLVPLLQIGMGRRSISKFTLLTSFASLAGMAFLRRSEMGMLDWSHVDFVGLLSSFFFAAQILRAEVWCARLDPLPLTAVQLFFACLLSLGWYFVSLFTSVHNAAPSLPAISSLPWVPLLYSGLVVGGIGALLELRSLRNVHASTATMIYTTIPLWGGLLTQLSQAGQGGGMPSTLEEAGCLFYIMTVTFFAWKSSLSSDTADQKDSESHFNFPSLLPFISSKIFASSDDSKTSELRSFLPKSVELERLRISMSQTMYEFKNKIDRMNFFQGYPFGEGGKVWNLDAILSSAVLHLDNLNQKLKAKPVLREMQKLHYFSRFSTLSWATTLWRIPHPRSEAAHDAPEGNVQLKSNAFHPSTAPTSCGEVTNSELLCAETGIFELNRSKEETDCDDVQCDQNDKKESPSLNPDALPGVFLQTQLKSPVYASNAQDFLTKTKDIHLGFRSHGSLPSPPPMVTSSNCFINVNGATSAPSTPPPVSQSSSSSSSSFPPVIASQSTTPITSTSINYMSSSSLSPSISLTSSSTLGEGGQTRESLSNWMPNNDPSTFGNSQPNPSPPTPITAYQNLPSLNASSSQMNSTILNCAAPSLPPVSSTLNSIPFTPNAIPAVNVSLSLNNNVASPSTNSVQYPLSSTYSNALMNGASPISISTIGPSTPNLPVSATATPSYSNTTSLSPTFVSSTEKTVIGTSPANWKDPGDADSVILTNLSLDSPCSTCSPIVNSPINPHSGNVNPFPDSGASLSNFTPAITLNTSNPLNSGLQSSTNTNIGSSMSSIALTMVAGAGTSITMSPNVSSFQPPVQENVLTEVGFQSNSIITNASLSRDGSTFSMMETVWKGPSSITPIEASHGAECSNLDYTLNTLVNSCSSSSNEILNLPYLEVPYINLVDTCLNVQDPTIGTTLSDNHQCLQNPPCSLDSDICLPNLQHTSMAEFHQPIAYANPLFPPMEVAQHPISHAVDQLSVALSSLDLMQHQNDVLDLLVSFPVLQDSGLLHLM